MSFSIILLRVAREDVLSWVAFIWAWASDRDECSRRHWDGLPRLALDGHPDRDLIDLVVPGQGVVRHAPAMEATHLDDDLRGELGHRMPDAAPGDRPPGPLGQVVCVAGRLRPRAPRGMPQRLDDRRDRLGRD